MTDSIEGAHSSSGAATGSNLGGTRIILNGSVRGCCVLFWWLPVYRYEAQSSLLQPLCVAVMAVHLGPFEVGQIWVLHRQGLSHRQMSRAVVTSLGLLFTRPLP